MNCTVTKKKRQILQVAYNYDNRWGKMCKNVWTKTCL